MLKRLLATSLPLASVSSLAAQTPAPPPYRDAWYGDVAIDFQDLRLKRVHP